MKLKLLQGVLSCSWPHSGVSRPMRVRYQNDNATVRSRPCRRRRGRFAAALTETEQCHMDHAVSSVIIPHIKQASSRAIDVLTTLTFFPAFQGHPVIPPAETFVSFVSVGNDFRRVSFLAVFQSLGFESVRGKLILQLRGCGHFLGPFTNQCPLQIKQL